MVLNVLTVSLFRGPASFSLSYSVEKNMHLKHWRKDADGCCLPPPFKSCWWIKLDLCVHFYMQSTTHLLGWGSETWELCMLSCRSAGVTGPLAWGHWVLFVMEMLFNILFNHMHLILPKWEQLLFFQAHACWLPWDQSTPHPENYACQLQQRDVSCCLKVHKATAHQQTINRNVWNETTLW